METADSINFKLESINPIYFSARSGRKDLTGEALQALEIKADDLMIDGEYIEAARLSGLRIQIKTSPASRRPYLVIKGEVRVSDPDDTLIDLVQGACDEPDAEIMLSLSGYHEGVDVELNLHEEPLMILSSAEVVS